MVSRFLEALCMKFPNESLERRDGQLNWMKSLSCILILFCFRGVFLIRAMSFVKRHKDDDGKRGT